jgi:hypothetical protein
MPLLLALAGLVGGCADDSAMAPAAGTDAGEYNAPDVDDSEVAKLLGTLSLEAFGRVDRMGMPAVATAVIKSKDAYNNADPTDDAAGAFVSEIVMSVGALHAALDDDLTGLGLTPCATNDCVNQAAPFVVPDVLRVDPSRAAGFPNGRRLPDTVIDITLALVLLDLGTHTPATLVGVNPTANDVPFGNSFPYLNRPFEASM